MEIDITEFVTNEDMQEAQCKPLLATNDELDAMRQWVEESGGWDDDERDAMTPVDLNALFIQLISGEIREMGLDDCDLEDFDWKTYQERASEGGISGNLFRGDIEGSDGFGRIFYCLI